MAEELKTKHGVKENDLSTWVCIAKHESLFDTTAINEYSGDHGLFQISELFWCGKNERGGVCKIDCAKFRDDDISDDFKCAKKIHKDHKRLQGDGFKAWVVYEQFCSRGRSHPYTEECY